MRAEILPHRIVQTITDKDFYPLPTEKQAQRERLAQDMADYLARGGVIHKLSSEDTNWRDWVSTDFQYSPNAKRHGAS